MKCSRARSRHGHAVGGLLPRFLRAGEMTVPSEAGFDLAVHLRREDIAVDDARAPTVLRVRLKQSKTDSSGKRSSCLSARC